MNKDTTTRSVPLPAGLEEAWQEVGASFERFCLTAGITTLASMMEEDAAQLCGPRYGRADGKCGHRWGKTTGKAGFHGGKVEIGGLAPVRGAVGRAHEGMDGGRPVRAGPADHPDRWHPH